MKITKEEGAKIKQDVIDRIKENFGMKGLKKLGGVLGLDAVGVTEMIEAKVEAAVLDVGSKVNP